MNSRRACTSVALIFVTYILLIAARFPLAAQENHIPYSQNAIYIEGLGPGLLYSVNYDRRITPNISVRLGFTYWSLELPFILTVQRISLTAFPLMVNFLTGEGEGHLELGIGPMPSFTSSHSEDIFGSTSQSSGKSVVGIATLGYRFQPREAGLFFRISFTPLFTFKKFVPWVGISVGGTF